MKAFAFFMNKELARTWMGWRSWYWDMMDQKYKLKRAFLRMRNRKWAIAWDHWYGRTDKTGCKHPVRVRLVVQDRELECGARPSRWLDTGEKYGIAVAKVVKPHSNSYESVGFSQATVEVEASKTLKHSTNSTNLNFNPT